MWSIIFRTKGEWEDLQNDIPKPQEYKGTGYKWWGCFTPRHARLRHSRGKFEAEGTLIYLRVKIYRKDLKAFSHLGINIH